MENEITVLIADDMELVREALIITMSRYSDILIIGEAQDGMEAVEKCHSLKPDILVIDVKMPVLDGIRATEQLAATDSRTQVIIHTMYADDMIVMEAIKAGVSGFVLKSGHHRELPDAIHAAAQHRAYFSPGIPPVLLPKMESLTN
ncbi:MAG: response regulator transcription factor [bacterium]|nr:response regulator transcription factor [bacterium]